MIKQVCMIVSKLCCQLVTNIVSSQALTDAAQSYNQNSSIFLSCYALLLFGVPNLGLQVVSLRSLVKDQPNSSLIADLDASSAFLGRHNFFWEFQKAEGTRVISVYETKPTATVKVRKSYSMRQILRN